jgi:hypothetical protein
MNGLLDKPLPGKATRNGPDRINILILQKKIKICYYSFLVLEGPFEGLKRSFNGRLLCQELAPFCGSLVDLTALILASKMAI